MFGYVILENVDYMQDSESSTQFINTIYGMFMLFFI